MHPHVSHRPEQIDGSVFIAAGARVSGDVTISAQSSVWYNAVLRGDWDAIRVGCQTNIQDLAVLHADLDVPCTIGDRVSLGHGAIVHGALVEDDVLIGMRAVVMNHVRIGRGSLIAVGSVVTEGTVVPPESVVMGVPGRVVRPTEDRDRRRIEAVWRNYIEAAALYREHLGEHGDKDRAINKSRRRGTLARQDHDGQECPSFKRDSKFSADP